MEEMPKKNRCVAEIELTYGSVRKAKSVLGAVDVDNLDYVEAERRGKTVVFRSASGEEGALRHTVDDLLSCVGVAEKMIGTVNEDRTEDGGKTSEGNDGKTSEGNDG